MCAEASEYILSIHVEMSESNNEKRIVFSWGHDGNQLEHLVHSKDFQWDSMHYNTTELGNRKVWSMSLSLNMN